MFGITRKYVAKQRGGSYVLQRRDPTALVAGAVWAAGGVIAILYGLWRRDRLGFLISLAGGAAALGAAANLELTPLPIRAQKIQGNGGPSYLRELETTTARQRLIDKVEEGLMESFPASDPAPHSAQ
jgi:hypothetical protein